MTKKLIFLFFIAMIMVFCSYNCYAQVNVDLTGVWNDDYGGTYYIRQLGNEVWWYGEERNENPGWSNVAHGYLEGDVLVLDWCDVPKGEWYGKGTLKIKVESSDGLVRLEQTGNFGSSTWSRKE